MVVAALDGMGPMRRVTVSSKKVDATIATALPTLIEHAGDLKPGNVVLSGSRHDRRGFTAKVRIGDMARGGHCGMQGPSLPYVFSTLGHVVLATKL